MDKLQSDKATNGAIGRQSEAMPHLSRDESIGKALQAYPLTQMDRREIVHEIREMRLLEKTHPELAIRCYTRINALLEMLDEESPDDLCDQTSAG